MKYRIIERNDGYRLYHVERRRWWWPFWSAVASSDDLEHARRLATYARERQQTRSRARRDPYVEYLP